MQSIVYKPLIYTAKTAVPEARKIFLTPEQISKTLKILGGKIMFALHMKRKLDQLETTGLLEHHLGLLIIEV